MSSRRLSTSAPLLLLGALAVAVSMSGCAKRPAPSLKDDAIVEHAQTPERKPRRVARAKKPAAAKALPASALSAQSQPQLAPQPQPKNTREPCVSAEHCAAELRAMLNDQSRSWIGKPQTVQEHLTGTRQFAYLALVKVMKCPELTAGLKDTQAGAQLRVPPEVYSAQVRAQIRDLDTHVQAELQKELKARCPR